MPGALHAAAGRGSIDRPDAKRTAKGGPSKSGAGQDYGEPSFWDRHDARPSDALNLAVRAGAPIFVDREVMDQHAIAAADAEERMLALEREWLEDASEPDQPGEWQSLSPEFVKSLHPGPRPK